MQGKLSVFAARIGFTGFLIILALALAVVQTVRLEGFSVWPLSVEGWKPRAIAAEATIARIEQAQDDALARAELAKAKAEAEYRNLAERIDDEADEARGDALALAEQFIASNRVRCPAVVGSASRPAPAAEDHGSGDGQAAGAVPELDAGLVVVPADDVRICTANTQQAQVARKWALELEAGPSK